ncbi:MAG: hypothetical protein JWM87_2728 [Candidatus Eremiobacteraeota bacterium]|nr:hypothetical protein [Candidatus Eremiobacteraeota bacterium]
MLARPHTLALVTTRRCTAACDHCCFGCSPTAQDAIPIERLHGLIDEAKRVPSIHRIGFTGGECFLLGRDLVALVAHAHELNFETRAITNGYWAHSERAARLRIEPLYLAGLDELMLSTGTFHQRFVPVERVALGARAAASFGIRTRISIEACDQSEFDAAGLRASLADLAGDGSVCIAEEPWIPDAGGRGASALSHDGILTRELAERARGACAQVLNVVTVTPRMQLTACCGFPNEELPELGIGSVAERPLDAVLSESPNMLLQMWLHVAGPAGIADFVASKDREFVFPAFASICHACVAIQRDERAMRFVVQHAGEIVGDIAARFAAAQPQLATASPC